MPFSGITAIVERDLRKYFRNPGLLGITLVIPILQLVVIGYAVGGRIRDVPVALVDLDGGSEAMRLRQKLQAVEAGPGTFRITQENGLDQALRGTRAGRLGGAVVIPDDFSEETKRGAPARFGLVVDNTNFFVNEALTAKFHEVAASGGAAPPRLAVVELFPYVEYIQHMLAGAIVLGIYVSCVIGGGAYVDDRADGLHEGYLSAPIARWELMGGVVLAGVFEASLAGILVTAAGSCIAGVAGRLTMANISLLLTLISVTSLALMTLASLLVVRVSSPLVSRGIFAFLNIFLFFPSGAVYPVAGFPEWLKAISAVDPFTYAVNGFRAVLLKGAGPEAIWQDLGILSVFSILCFAGSCLLFPRRL